MWSQLYSRRTYITSTVVVLDKEAIGGTRPDHNALPLRIGGSPDIGEMFAGVIDEVAFFDHPLTEQEIQGFMERLAAVEPAGKLVAAWGGIKAEH